MASIEKRGDNSYRLVVEAGYDPTGKRIKRSKTVKVEEQMLKRPKQLKDHLDLELAKFRMEVEHGKEYVAPEKMTFGAFVEEWKTKYAEKELEVKTLDVYLSHLKIRVLPHFEKMKLEQIRTMHLVTFLDSLGREGSRLDGKAGSLSSGTIGFICVMLRNLFRVAVEWQLIKVNPMTGIKKPKREKPKVRFYDESEIRHLMQILAGANQKWRMLFLTAIFSGCRRGEIIALEWDKINFEMNYISIENSIPHTINGEAYVKKPKTESSIRFVDMPVWFMDELKEYYKEWKARKKEVGSLWRGSDKEYIFHNGFGKPFRADQPTRMWSLFLKANNLRHINFHALRHTSATMLLESGASLKAIQERLGHSNIKITSDIYAHVTKKLSRDTAEKFDKFAPNNTKVN